ncbi:MAG: hypothetical protein GEU75_15355 [Dehalococcoidia bacterium]|nr:hypothetical protein [Dehalococcoidia bacterium]
MQTINLQAQPERNESSVRIAPFALLRVAAVPYERLTALTPPRTTALVNEALAADAAMEAQREALEDLLYDAVPRIDDAKLRGAAVELRRDVHNGRRPAIGEPQRTALLAHMGRAEQEPLRAWFDAQRRYEASLARGRDALADETRTHLRCGLRELTQEIGFSQGLALSSPDLIDELEREAVRPQKGMAASSLDRSLLSYAARAAAKTSPFSTFMHVAPVEIRLDGPATVPDVDRATSATRVELNRGILTRLYALARARSGDHGAGTVRVNPTLRLLGDGQVEALIGEYTAISGRAWRQDRVARFRFHPAVSAIIVEQAGRECSRSDLIARLAGVGLTEEQARDLLARLLERGLLTVPAIVDAFDAHPEAEIFGALADRPAAGIAPVSTPVGEITRSAAALAEADGPTRRRLIADIRRREAEAFAIVGNSPTGYQDVVLEDGWLAGAQGAIGEPLAELIVQLGAELRSRVELAPDYPRLRDAFVHRYGSGGRCSSLMTFLMDAGLGLLRSLRAEPPALDGGDGSASFAPDRISVGVTALVQIAAQDAAAAARGEALVVVNRVYDGVGWLAARHAVGDEPEKAALADQLRRWIVDAVYPREPVDLLFNGECNNLQAHPRLTSRVLVWPTEPIRPETPGLLPVDEIALRHNERTNLIELVDSEGMPISPMYLGCVQPLPTWGLAYLLVRLAQPYQIRRPLLTPPDDPSVDIDFRPRVVNERIVLGRATWWIRSRWLRSAWFAESGIRRLVRVAASRGTQGLPEVFFAQAYLPLSFDRTDLPADVRKPLWVDTRNPFCLDLLERVLDRGEWVIVREMLPASDELWMSAGGGRRVSEVQVELLI